ncbi:hypothetical protein MHPYR_310080 [uncultured Mycobacterium sp.]|uniref:Uncharacterized protein n=1 Tax=uncultured Mycobacterium sp. TaxID=171292 RepID=A0A1Y5PCH1_9MYCO|nr:hypothetical protein MHPYR_310080 [uncultured Mycobacterium sp.]
MGMQIGDWSPISSDICANAHRHVGGFCLLRGEGLEYAEASSEMVQPFNLSLGKDHRVLTGRANDDATIGHALCRCGYPHGIADYDSVQLLGRFH